MALPQWELDRSDQLRVPEADDRPRLGLAPPPPPRGRPLIAAALALLVIGALAAPVISAAIPEPVVHEQPRALPASALVGLDRVVPIDRADIPRSGSPVGGLAFVRCTRLWTAWPDGSNPRRVLDMPGISSPTFSPDARTIAFTVWSDSGPELWAAAADGSAVRRLATLTHAGAPVEAQVSGLTWSPDGHRLGFALRASDYGPFEGGSSIWDLDLELGWFTKLGHGWPQPVWVGRKLAYTRFSEGGKGRLYTGMETIRNIVVDPATRAADVTEALSWLEQPRFALATIERGPHGGLELLLRKSQYSRPDRGRVVSLPRGLRIPAYARPTLAQAGSRVSISLIARDGSPEIGIYNTALERWTVLPYAWQPSASPAPEVVGSSGKQRAAVTAGNLLGNWNAKGFGASLLIGKPRRDRVMPFDDMEFRTEEPAKDGKDWIVPATVYGFEDDTFLARALDVRVSTKEGRMVARPESISPPTHIETVDDALAFLRSTLTVPVLTPHGLPEGTTLSERRGFWPVWTYDYDGRTTGTLNLTLPDGGELMFDYGRGYFHSCGEFEGRPADVNGQPALFGADGSGAHQVMWPITRESYRDGDGADFSVYARLPTDEVIALAESMTP